MANVLIPERQAVQKSRGHYGESKILPMVGAVVGGVYGGLGGASAGMGVGTAANSMLGIEGERTWMERGPSSQGLQSAASRRMAKIESDPYTKLAQANAALEYAPKDVQEAYKKPLEEAMMIAQRSRQAGGLA